MPRSAEYEILSSPRASLSGRRHAPFGALRIPRGAKDGRRRSDGLCGDDASARRRGAPPQSGLRPAGRRPVCRRPHAGAARLPLDLPPPPYDTAPFETTAQRGSTAALGPAAAAAACADVASGQSLDRL